MGYLDQYKDVWVITIADPAIGIEEQDVVMCVCQSEETAKRCYEELMNDDEKQEHVKYFIEVATMFLDETAQEAKS